jgi:NDP-sugar pyrophosphorylase family protein
MLKKVVILAGVLGTCLGEETEQRRKPMIEVGGRPKLWHIMKIYSHYGVSEFVIWSVASRRSLDGGWINGGFFALHSLASYGS